MDNCLEIIGFSKQLRNYDTKNPYIRLAQHGITAKLKGVAEIMTRKLNLTPEQKLKRRRQMCKDWMKKNRTGKGLTQRRGPDGHWHYVPIESELYLKRPRGSYIRRLGQEVERISKIRKSKKSGGD
jgi:hypothetical protein